MVEFFIPVTGWNCSGRAKRCYTSLASQTYTNFKAVFISDNSTDGTNQEIKDLPKQKWLDIQINTKNYGAAYNRYMCIKKYNPKDVIMLLDMDDELMPDCLELIEREYKKGMWMTYGNWKNQRGQINSMELYFDKITHKKRDYRNVKYRSTHPKTFKAFLFNSIPEDDFIIDGKWLTVCTEAPMVYACLEMCGKDKIGVIEKPIYLYNQWLPHGTIRTQGSGYKREILAKICARPKKKPFR